MKKASPLTYLALGDSYTIGESVERTGNFPNQLVKLLREDGLNLSDPHVIATTGWTTDELKAGIQQEKSSGHFSAPYDMVTLLIGVNNQYRGRSVIEYGDAFEDLLKDAITYAGEKKEHVAVISIPDWGVTPFANGRDRMQIAKEIDEFNQMSRDITKKYNVHYIDITPWTREAINNGDLLAEDGLHPSAKEYKRWSEALEKYFKHLFQPVD